jgi:hypothetical protein
MGVEFLKLLEVGSASSLIFYPFGFWMADSVFKFKYLEFCEKNILGQPPFSFKDPKMRTGFRTRRMGSP